MPEQFPTDPEFGYALALATSSLAHIQPDLSRLDPEQTMSLYENLGVAADFESSHQYPIQFPYSRMRWEMAEALARLPGADVDRARLVYGAFANSNLVGRRKTGASFVRFLTPADHDYGLELWSNLVIDPADDVRDRAYDEIGRLADLPKKGANRALKSYGITALDALRLQQKHQEAVASGNFREISTQPY